jgi:hypothetical protein
MEKLWDLVGVWSLLYMVKSKEPFIGVDSGVRGEESIRPCQLVIDGMNKY